MRNYKTLILEAELLASPAERIHQWLENRAAKMEGVKRTMGGDDAADLELEKALLNRHEPLIDLALAQFTSKDDIARELFERRIAKDGKTDETLRLAVLTNQLIGKMGVNFFPKVLFGTGRGYDEAVLKWFSEATPNELLSLFNNPTIDELFLRDFLEGKKPWEALSEDNRQVVIYALSKNPRMSREYDGLMDGWAEYSHGAVFNAAWKLAEHAPTSRSWARILSELYNGLRCEAFSLENPLEVSKRWIPEDEKAKESEVSCNGVGCLGDYQNVRAGLGRLALAKDKDIGDKLLASDDVALRVAAYSDMRLTPEQITAAYKRDKLIAVNRLVYNENLWRTEKTRSTLHDVSWKAVKEDKHSDLMAANIFNGVRDVMEKKHPQWFADEDKNSEAPALAPESSNEPATKADVHRVLEAVGVRPDGTEPILTSLKQVNVALQGLGKTLGWVWWFTLGALAMLLWRR